MELKSAGFSLSILLALATSHLHSQDEANKAIREYKERVANANKAYSDSVESARGKKKQVIEAASKAALNALKADLAKTGPGDIARAIELAKRIYQLDPTDREARKILLAANIDLGGDAPPEATRAPVENPVKPPVPQKDPAQLKAPRAVVPAQAPVVPPIQPLAATPSNFGVFGANSNQAPGSGNYPIQVNKRPLTLPKGAYSALGELYRWKITDIRNVYGLNYGAEYGISDSFQVGFDHSLRLSGGVEFTEAPLTLNTLFAHKFDFGSSNLSAGIRATLPLYLEGSTLNDISIGLPCRLNFANDRVALWLGERPRFYFNEGVMNFRIRGEDAVALNLPIGMSFQVSENLNLGIFTRIYRYASYESEPTHRTYNLGNYRPFNLLASYAIDPASEIFMGFEYEGYPDLGFSDWSVSFGYIFRGF